MKILKISIIALFTTFFACNSDDDNEVKLSTTEIPVTITDFVETHFASNTINNVYKDIDTNETTYEVHLSNNLELEFNSNFEILSIDGASKLPDTVIPESILNYITTNYPNNFITDWELETNYQQIELDNNVELDFTLEGDFIKIDNDKNKDEIVLNETEFPTSLKDYISTYFPSNDIISVIKDTDDNLITYEVYLKNNLELEFNNDFEIISIDGTSKLPDTVIPESILTYITANYPNNFITDWELETNYQEVELDNNVELDFTLEGDFIKIDKN
ncbi:PepSY-like domain-containing protein [Lutibacter sp. A64]|uniref:PepSY-like domain-containing protein n=1 Tax=Lutibacter sp. A64 TaxID=2918526 RepID=UPI001F05C9CE|nr:PepSY-like domain-containing protein [Lutibacter sp. A64]UMB54746.1 PepSY-like domain-containing protein [Lutibacter sp. A64]